MLEKPAVADFCLLQLIIPGSWRHVILLRRFRFFFIFFRQGARKKIRKIESGAAPDASRRGDGVSRFLGLFFWQGARKITPKIRKRHSCGRRPVARRSLLDVDISN